MADALDPLPAGEFGAWLGELAGAISGRGETDVACGTCVACCSSSQFVHVEADEADALAHIPADLLVPAPGLTDGTKVMGYDEEGRCPMLGEHGCTIYDHRPRTCRVFDCRVFAATGVFPSEPWRVSITQQARRWSFEFASPASESTAVRVRSSAEAFVRANPDAPAMQVAVTVLKAELPGR